MDYEDMMNFTNVTMDEELFPSTSSGFMAQEILLTLFAIIGIISDSFIVYVILKFERMKNVSNIFLANWAIADIMSLIITPNTYRIFSMLADFGLSARFLCVLMEVQTVLNTVMVIFITLVSLEWMFACYLRNVQNFTQKNYKYILACVWIISFVQMGFFSGNTCFTEQFYNGYSYRYHLLTYVILFLLVTGLQISRGVQIWRKQPLVHPTLMLTLSTIFTLCWMFVCFSYVYVYFFLTHPVVSWLVDYFLHGSSSIYLLILYIKDIDFKTSFRQIFKRNLNIPYQKSMLRFDNPIVRNNGQTTTQDTDDNHEVSLISYDSE